MAVSSGSHPIAKRSLHFLDVAEEKNQTLPPIKGYEDKELVSLEHAVKPIESLVPNVQEMVSDVKNGSSLSIENLSIDESASIRLYSLGWEPREKSFFYILNQTLRAEDRSKLKPWFSFLKLILTALGHLPSISITVYRGVKLDLSNQYVEGAIFTWWGFSSCTSSEKVLESDQFLGTKGKRTKFIINCKNGKDIRTVSFYPNEFEVLLLPATRFRVMKCSKSSSDLTIIELEEFEARPFPIPHPPYSNPALERRISRCDCSAQIFLDNLNLTDVDMWIVVEQALNKKQCVELSLAKNRAITVEGISIIALALQNNRTLLNLSITHLPKFSDESAKVLAEGLRRNQHLQVLDLSHNAIEDSGAEKLAEMLSVNQTLRDLDLADNQIQNQGVQYLATALCQSNKTLKRLSLNWNPIYDGCVDPLIEMLKKNQTLKEIEILQTVKLSVEAKSSLTEVGKERLK